MIPSSISPGSKRAMNVVEVTGAYVRANKRWQVWQDRGCPDPEGYNANMSSVTSKWGGIPSVKIETQPENPGPTVVPVYWWQLWPLLIFGWCVSCDYLSWLDLDTVEKALVTSQMTIMNGATWGCHWTWSGSCSKAKQDDLVDHQAQQVGSPVLNCPGLPHCHEILSTTASSSLGEGVFWPLSPGKGSSLALNLSQLLGCHRIKRLCVRPLGQIWRLWIRWSWAPLVLPSSLPSPHLPAPWNASFQIPLTPIHLFTGQRSGLPLNCKAPHLFVCLPPTLFFFLETFIIT